MKILHTVQLYEPHKGGSEEVVRQVSERLAARGHEVTVATGFHPSRTFSELNGVRIEQFRVTGNDVRGIIGEADRYTEFLSDQQFDVMMNYAAQIWSTDLALPLIGRLRFPAVFVPCGYSSLYDPAFARYFSELPKYLSKYDRLVYMSRNYRDYAFGEKHGFIDRAEIIPNAAAAEEFDAPSPPFKSHFGIESRLLILSVSNHYHLKGHAQTIRAFKAARLEDADLVIIGEGTRNPRGSCLPQCRTKALLDRRIRILSGLSRAEVVSAYKDADAFLFTSEVECAPLVIYESMAAGIPFVSTDVGNVRDHESHGVVVDDRSQLGDELGRLLEDEARRKDLGSSGKAAWKKAHTWDIVTDLYERLYRRLAA